MTAAEPGSFRDPSGRVFETDGRIFRTITTRALADYTFVESNRNRGAARAVAANGAGWTLLAGMAEYKGVKR